MKSVLTPVELCHLVNLFGAGFALILALSQIVIRYRTVNNIIIALYLIMFSLWQIMRESIYYGLDNRFSFNVYTISLPAYYCSIPLLYLFFMNILDPRFVLNWRHMAHFIPAVLALVILLPFSNDTVMIYPIMNMFQPLPENTGGLLLKALMYLCSIIYLSYFFILFGKTRHLRKYAKKESLKIINITLSFIVVYIIFQSLWIINYMFSLHIAVFSNCLAVITLIFAFLLVIRYPEFIMVVHHEAEQPRYARSKIGNIDPAPVLEQLDSLMKEEKLFRDYSLNLPKLAELLDLSPHQLSEIINTRLETSFFNLINTYRVEEAKELLLKDRGRRILAIAYEAGFNSSSAFYNAFNRIVGVSPTRFRDTV